MNKAILIRCFGDEVDEVSRRRVYNASILGYMYRNQELPAALTRGQFLHLDAHNAVRISNAEYLSGGAWGGSPGSAPPSARRTARHVYFMYNVHFDPAAAGEHASRGPVPRRGGESAVREGVLCGQWQQCRCRPRTCSRAMLGYGG